jgi:hypothetical protein
MLEKLVREGVVQPKLTLRQAKELVARIQHRQTHTADRPLNLLRRLQKFEAFLLSRMKSWSAPESQLVRRKLSRILVDHRQPSRRRMKNPNVSMISMAVTRAGIAAVVVPAAAQPVQILEAVRTTGSSRTEPESIRPAIPLPSLTLLNATGLHWWNPKSQKLEESVEAFELTPEGYAVARRGQHKAIVAGNINEGGSVDLEFPDGQRFLSNPMGISYYDSSTGQNVLLAEVKDCGELVTPNVIVFWDAFDGLAASIRYTYTKAGFEQDIILRERPAPPEAYGLDPDSVTLECYTEVFESPQPRLVSPGAEVGVEDRALDFGSMRIGLGLAYFLCQPA